MAPVWANRARAALLAVPITLTANLALADDRPAPMLPSAEQAAEKASSYSTTVTTENENTAASSKTVRDRDLLLRPIRRPADVLSVVPGLYVVQHSGGGKANQYFMRGFDADHGTDIALSVDGIPVNAVSHGHGQGYADMNWLIPEAVKRVEVSKGPYEASQGDFATAGSVNLVTKDFVDASSLTLGGGQFGTYRATVATSPEIHELSPLVIAHVYGTDGPFENEENLQRVALFAKVTRRWDHGRLAIAVTSYDSAWKASGQIPMRAIRDGRLDRFGTVDPTEGGSSDRHSVYASMTTTPTHHSEMTILAYTFVQRLALFSNFTFFSGDPIHGDMIEQNDSRTTSGVDAKYWVERDLGGLGLRTSFGARLRTDSIDNALWHDERRERLEAIVRAHVRETSLSLWGEESVRFAKQVRGVVGARLDHFGFAVDDQLEDVDDTAGATSGVRQAWQVSPKASLIITPHPSTSVFLNAGIGFHSNDARGTIKQVDPVTPLTRAVGYEVGARTKVGKLDLAGAGYVLDLGSELVWVGDEGTTEARGSTRRIGAELEARVRILRWLHADLDAGWSRATYVSNAGNGDAVALAPTFTSQGGLSARHRSGTYGRLGFFLLADRPATEDEFLTAQGFTRIDATLGYGGKWGDLSISGQNLLDADVREAQFANVSRLRDETAASSCPAGTRAAEEGGQFLGCEDLHITPGAPINVQAALTLLF